MKHLIALIATALSIAAIIFMANLDKEANKFQEIQNVIAKSKQEVKISQISKPIKIEDNTNTQEKDENEEKLKALKEKAGNLAAFDVSPLYKRKCSSCHGVNGEGIIGPRLIGRTKEFVLNNLRDFKSGKRKNYVMFGLLNNMKDEDLVKLATEIGTFEEKMKNSKK
jgi:cytochrome c553